jgi:dTDP-4-amino-4,6-dideoxygalactose transaminase
VTKKERVRMKRWKYPLSDIRFGKEEERAVLKVLRSRWLSTGPMTEKFERAFSDYLGGGYAIAVSSGTAALHLALACLGLKRGDEVILPSLTFAATANAVLYVGAKPVFADIVGPENLNISPQEVEKRITGKTRAVMVMHYGGYPCDMDPILHLAARRHLHVVEDAAHAPGARYGGKMCGTIGDAGCFSFFANKNLVTGEGGMIVVRNREHADTLRRLRSHGMGSLSWDKFKGHLSSYDIDRLGYNYRTTEIESALGLVQLKKLDQGNRIRKTLTETYREELRGIKALSIPFARFNGSPSCHLFPILVNPGPGGDVFTRRSRLMESLKTSGIQTSVHYPPVHLFSLYRREKGVKKRMLPRTEDVSRRVMTLPLHPGMGKKDVKWIAGKIREAMGRE